MVTRYATELLDAPTWAPRRRPLAALVLFHAALIAGLHLILHVRLLPQAWTFAGMYAFVAAIAVGSAIWTRVVEQRPLTYLGLRGPGMGAALGFNLFFGSLLGAYLIAYRSLDAVPHYLMPALVSGLFEAVYIYGWVHDQLRRVAGLGASIAGTAALYALYHIGYFGLTGRGWELLGLSCGLYFLVGFVNACIYRYTGSIWSLWPVLLTVATIDDYLRVGLPLPRQDGALLMVLIAFAGGLAALARGDTHGAEWAEVPRSRPLAARAAALAADLGAELAANRRRFAILLAACSPILVTGLFLRFVINDPLGVETLPPSMAAAFQVPRSPMNDVTLRVGFAFYYVTPLVLTLLWWNVGVREPGGAAVPPRLGGKALLSSLAFPAVMLAMLPLAAAVSIAYGHVPSAGEVGRYGLVAAALAFYALLHFSVVAIVSLAAREARWIYLTLFVIYTFIYNWWMIYPLLSSLNAIGVAPQSGAAADAWMRQVTERIIPLYSMVPHYNYYMALTVTYLRNALDASWFLTAFLSLVTYAAAFFVAAQLWARETLRHD